MNFGFTSSTTTNKLLGRVFDVQRFSIYDGPGIRTTVFFKGCPLRCQWCHNPEGRDWSKRLSFNASVCIECGSCVSSCPHGVHTMDAQQGHILERQRCQACGDCVASCNTEALELVGRDMTVDEVLEEVLKDRDYYKTSGGGLTLSGGEPLGQFLFAESLLKEAQEADLHCVVETCGYVKSDKLLQILPLVDLFLYDIKELVDHRHKEMTGVSNVRILDNLNILHDQGASILVRLPIIPGLNDREEHFDGVARLVQSLPQLIGVEVMPYHNLGQNKMTLMGVEGNTELTYETPEAETIAQWVCHLREKGITVHNEV